MVLEILGFIGLAITLIAFQFNNQMVMRVGLFTGCAFFLTQAIGTATVSLIVTNSLFLITHLIKIIQIKRLTNKS